MRTVLAATVVLGWWLLMSSSLSPLLALFGRYWQESVYAMGWAFLAVLVVVGRRQAAT